MKFSQPWRWGLRSSEENEQDEVRVVMIKGWKSRWHTEEEKKVVRCREGQGEEFMRRKGRMAS